MSDTMSFKESEKINVTKHMEKKGKFTYLSWPFAVSEFRKACPEGTWRIIQCENGSPYYKDGSGCYVSVTVIPDTEKPDVQFTQIHPVLNHQNKSILEPNAFDVNTSIQRCLVKAIALATGIGLHIYAGEDLPPTESNPAAEAKIAAKAATGAASLKAGNIAGWIAAATGEIMKGRSAADYWKEYRQKIIDDCGEDGAKEVHAKVIK